MERRAQATEALFARSKGQEALDSAIRAAELYMNAAAEATSKSNASRLRRKCHELIAQAEQLKKQLNPKKFIEHDIIRSASRLHGNNFPLWKSDPLETEFQLPPSGEPYTDDAIFALSETQRATLVGWKRPRDAFNLPDTAHALESDATFESLFMDTSKPIDLAQDVTTDCSVVAGLSAAIKILTGKQSVLSTIIYPFDHAKRRPGFSSSGKYVLRLNFNGCYRRVVIDDRLPVSTGRGKFFVFDLNQNCLLWPALLEKAYLKVRGGYDFPGSNSGTDLWVLTGWIPEQIFLQREDLDINQVWKRIKSFHDSQNLVITIGTGCIPPEEERATGLVGEHDYTVQALEDSDGVKRLCVKNPWWSGPTWEPSSTCRQGAESGCWVTLQDVVQNFESMYLNWNPKLFPHRQDHHFKWDMPPALLAQSLVRNPQFTVDSPKGGLVWILISRHFVDAELDILRRKDTVNLKAASRQLGFMSILVFDSKGQRVQIADGETYRGPYVDSPQTLARLDTTAGKSYTIVLDQHEFPLRSYTFTLSAFSYNPTQVHEAAEPLTHSKEETGSWTRRTAGGSAACPTYFSNPQYSLTLPRATPLSLLLSTDSRDVHVHLDLVWAYGKRVTSVRVRDLVTSSGEYQRGCAVADISHVDSGTYTLIVSTFEANQVADFALRISSMVPVTLTPIPVDAAGRLRTPLPPLSLSEQVSSMRAPISINWLTGACVSLHATSRQTSSLLLRLSVVMGRGPEQVTVAISGDGEFQEPSIALRTPEFDIEPERVRSEGLWVLVEGMGMSRDMQAIEGVLFSDSPAEVGAWDVM